jgi:hypothetical protein
MTQSDALPLQWTPEGKLTFNEMRYRGIEHKCWFQPWRCDVDVIDQFYDGSIRDYVLRALDAQGVQIFEKTYDVINFNFFEPLADWTQIAGLGPNWTGIGTTTPSLTMPSFAAESDKIKCNVTAPADRTYRVFYTFTVANDPCTVQFAFRNAGADITPLPAAIALPVGTTSGYLDIPIDTDADDFTLVVTCVLGQEPTLTVNSMTLYDTERINTNIVYVVAFNPNFEGICKKLVKFELWDVTDDPEVRISRTDLMDFRQSDSMTMFEYKALQNYSGLTYLLPDLTADQLFRLCVEGVFAHDRELTEEVTVELTEATIGTATSLKIQKQLTVQDAPDYFHRKVQLMLAHGFIGSVTDDLYNRTWIREEKYDKVLRDRRYILKEGNVQLTDINYLKRAVI